MSHPAVSSTWQSKTASSLAAASVRLPLRPARAHATGAGCSAQTGLDLAVTGWPWCGSLPPKSTLSTASTASGCGNCDEETCASEHHFGRPPVWEDPWKDHPEIAEEDWQAWLADFRARRFEQASPLDGSQSPPSTSVQPAVPSKQTDGAPDRPARRTKLPSSCLIGIPDGQLTMERVRRASARAQKSVVDCPRDSPRPLWLPSR